MIPMRSHLDVDATFAVITIFCGDRCAEACIERGDPKRLSTVLNKGDMPDGFWWAGDLTSNNGKSREEVCQAARIMWGSFLSLVDGPILCQCRRGLVPIYNRLLGSMGYKVSVVRGSLRGDNPYPPLVYDNSKDDHIIRVDYGR